MKEIVNRLQENRQVELAKSILESHGYRISKKLRESEEDPDIQRTILGVTKNSEHVVSDNPEDYVKYYDKIKNIVDTGDITVDPVKYFGSQLTGSVILYAPITVSKEEALKKLESIYRTPASFDKSTNEYRFNYNVTITRRNSKGESTDGYYVSIYLRKGIKDPAATKESDARRKIILDKLISSLEEIGWNIRRNITEYTGTLIDDEKRSLSRKSLDIIRDNGFKKTYSGRHSAISSLSVYYRTDANIQLDYIRKDKDELQIALPIY